jgi:uncharacterized Zn-binding protein involved in type VI secretion
MPGVVRTGDINSAGGAAIRGSSSVLVNGRGVVAPGSSVSPHPCCGAKGCEIHCVAVVVGPGSSTVLVEGKRVIRQGDSDICGHSRMTASTDVICG